MPHSIESFSSVSILDKAQRGRWRWVGDWVHWQPGGESDADSFVAFCIWQQKNCRAWLWLGTQCWLNAHEASNRIRNEIQHGIVVIRRFANQNKDSNPLELSRLGVGTTTATKTTRSTTSTRNGPRALLATLSSSSWIFNPFKWMTV